MKFRAFSVSPLMQSVIRGSERYNYDNKLKVPVEKRFGGTVTKGLMLKNKNKKILLTVVYLNSLERPQFPNCSPSLSLCLLYSMMNMHDCLCVCVCLYAPAYEHTQ